MLRKNYNKQKKKWWGYVKETQQPTEGAPNDQRLNNFNNEINNVI